MIRRAVIWLFSWALILAPALAPVPVAAQASFGDSIQLAQLSLTGAGKGVIGAVASPPSVVRSGYVNVLQGGGLSVSVSVGSPIASGNALVWGIRSGSGLIITSPSDNGGASPAYSLDLDLDSGVRVRGYSRVNITDAPTAFTFTANADNQFLNVYWAEVSGLGSAPVLDAAGGTQNSQSGTTAPTHSLTTLANSILFGWVQIVTGGTTTMTGASGSATLGTPGAQNDHMMWIVPGSAGSNSITGTLGASRDTRTFVWALKGQ